MLLVVVLVSGDNTAHVRPRNWYLRIVDQRRDKIRHANFGRVQYAGSCVVKLKSRRVRASEGK